MHTLTVTDTAPNTLRACSEQASLTLIGTEAVLVTPEGEVRQHLHPEDAVTLLALTPGTLLSFQEP